VSSALHTAWGRRYDNWPSPSLSGFDRYLTFDSSSTTFILLRLYETAKMPPNRTPKKNNPAANHGGLGTSNHYSRGARVEHPRFERNEHRSSLLNSTTKRERHGARSQRSSSPSAPPLPEEAAQKEPRGGPVASFYSNDLWKDHARLIRESTGKLSFAEDFLLTE
jgi:hypothetical protein